MKREFIVITEEHFFEEEYLWINAFFLLGLPLLHLRKPFSKCYELEELIHKIDARYYDRITLHDHFGLAEKYSVGGVHLNSRNPVAPHGFGGRISRSCHSFEEVRRYKSECNYVTLSPIFNSISKQGYSSVFSADSLEMAKNDGTIDSSVVALGGIGCNNILSVKEMGFGGVAVLGSVWRCGTLCSAGENLKRMMQLFL